MSFRPRSYPHPVLSPSTRDYIGEASFFGAFSCSKQDSDLLITYQLTLKSDRLNEFLADSQARVGLSVYAKGSRWKSLLPADTFSGSFTIPESDVFGTLEITPVIVSAVDETLEFEGINPEFGTKRFAVKEGDLLAHGPTEAMETAHQTTTAEGESWIVFSLDQTLDPNEYEIQTAHDAIMVYAGANVMLVTNAMSANPTLRPYLYTSIYKDAFVAALDSILASFQSEEEPEEEWARGLQAYMESCNLSLDELSGGDRNDVLKFVLRLTAGDGLGALAQDIKEGRLIQ